MDCCVAARHRRGVDRVHSRVIHRAFDSCWVADTLSERVRYAVRSRHPARCNPGCLSLFCPEVVKRRASPSTRPTSPAVCGCPHRSISPVPFFGLALHGFIKSVLFSPAVVAVSLTLGGIAILVIERLAPLPRCHRIEEMPMRTALAIGLCQVLSMIPGVSRAGATILGGVALGVDRRTATEFSFFLAIPTMLGAAAVDLWKTPAALDRQSWTLIGIGFAAALVVALIVVQWFMRFVSRHGFSIFGWYRIAMGIAMAALLIVR